MAAALGDGGIPCRIHVRANIARKHEDNGSERDREIRIQFGGQQESRLWASDEGDDLKWHTSSYKNPTPKHKPITVNLFLENEARKSKDDKLFKQVEFEIYEADIKQTILTGEFQPKLKWSITEFILLITEGGSTECFPLLPVTLLISPESASLESYPQEMSAEPSTKDRVCVQTKCLKLSFLLRLQTETKLKTFEGDDLRLEFSDLENRTVSLDVRSYKLFRHYHMFHLPYSSALQQTAIPVVPTEINLIFLPDQEFGENDKLYAATNLFYKDNCNIELKKKILKKEGQKDEKKFTATSRKLLLLKNGTLFTFENNEVKFHLENQNSQRLYEERTLTLAQGIEPGILTYDILIDGLNSEPIVSPYLPTYQLPREQILLYFHSLLQKTDLKYTLEEVKSKYAERLVPQVRLDGGYDMRFAASRPYEIHDIWGFEGEDLSSKPPKIGTEDHIEVSAIEHCSQLGLKPENAETKTTKEIRENVIKRLHQRYKAREKLVFEKLRNTFTNFKFVPKEASDNEKLSEDDKKNYIKAIITGGKSVSDQPDINQQLVTMMMQNAAAIVRGRLECFLVSPEFSRLSSRHYGGFRPHLDAAGAWFVFLMFLNKNNNGDFLQRIIESDRPKAFSWVEYAKNLPGDETNQRNTSSVDFSLDSVQLKMDHLPRDGILWYFYSMLNGRFSDKVSKDFKTFEAIKKTFAKPLVPKITIEGKYDRRFTASKLNELGIDIWGSGDQASDDDDGSDCLQPVTQCALEFPDPKKAFERLERVFCRNEQAVFGKCEDVRHYEDHDKKILKMIDFANNFQGDLSELLLQKTAAIVRGCCESLLVDPKLTCHNEASEGNWKKEIRTIGLWFSFLMVVYSKKRLTKKDYLKSIRDPKLVAEPSSWEPPKVVFDYLRERFDYVLKDAPKGSGRSYVEPHLIVLVPVINPTGGYNSKTPGRLWYKYHDIWGIGGVSPGDNHFEARASDFPNTKAAFEQLRQRYFERSRLVFETLLRRCFEKFSAVMFHDNRYEYIRLEIDKEMYSNFSSLFVEAVPSIQWLVRDEIPEPVYKLLMQNSAAIVRGRVESLLVNPDLRNPNDPKYNANWKKEIELICAWFHFLAVVWCARPTASPHEETKRFRNDIKEPNKEQRHDWQRYLEYTEELLNDNRLAEIKTSASTRNKMLSCFSPRTQ